MLMIDDLVESYGALKQSARAWLRERGVPDTAMIGWPGPVGIGRIHTYDDGFFEFNGDGQRASVMPLHDGGRYSDIVDALAFRASDPATFWVYHGAVSARGDVESLNPDRPARIHPTPLDRLAAGGAGLVVLDQLGAAPLLRMLTEDGPGVLFHPDAYNDALDLELLLIGPPRPRLRIFIQEAEKDLVAA